MSDARAPTLHAPEGVALELPVAGPAARILAYGIDVVVMVFFGILILVLLAWAGPVVEWIGTVLSDAVEAGEADDGGARFRGGMAAVLVILVLAQFVLETGYFIFWEMVTNGSSPGKDVVGLRVVREGGLPLDFQSSALRNLLRLADLLPGSYVAGLVSMILSEHRQRIGDHVAGTLVIRRDRPEPAAEIRLPESTTPLPLSRSQLEEVGAREIQLVRSTLRRVDRLDPERSGALLDKVSSALSGRLGIAPEERGDPRTFLERLLLTAERKNRLR